VKQENLKVEEESMESKAAKPSIYCVIYDCDGVLFDSLDANRMLYNRIAEHMGRSPLSNEELGFCHTHTVYESIRCLFPGDSVKEALASEFLRKRIDFKDFVPYLKMEPDLLEVLTELGKQGILRAICTNRTTSMPYVMERYSLGPYFETVVTALDVTNPKPHPEAVLKILKTLNVEKNAVLYVGDSEVDRDTARSAGVRFIAYKNREIVSDNGSDVYIDKHLKLLDYLRNEASPRPSSCP
jgi:phosphoglycolate phosphatase